MVAPLVLESPPEDVEVVTCPVEVEPADVSLEDPALVASSGGADTEPISLLTPIESLPVELVTRSPPEEAIGSVGEMGPQLAVRRRRAGMVRMVGGLSPCQRRDSRWVEARGGEGMEVRSTGPRSCAVGATITVTILRSA